MTNFGDNPPYGTPSSPGPQQPYPQYGQPQYPQPQYGQPQYGQPQYPQLQYPQPQYGQPQYGQSPYGAPQSPSPSGGTAITAAVLSLLGGAWYVVGTIGGLIALVTFSTDEYGGVPGWYFGILVLNFIGAMLACAALIAGGVLLLRRKTISRSIIAAGCGIVIVIQVVGVIVALALTASTTAQIGDAGGLVMLGAGTTVVFSLFFLIFPVITAILTYLPSTLLWIQARPTQQAPSPR